MIVFTFFLALIAIIISMINVFLMIQLIKATNEKENVSSINFDEETNQLLARFQKITSTRLRALDNKIEIIDQLLKDVNEAYSKTVSILTEAEKLNDEALKNLREPIEILKIKEEKKEVEVNQKFENNEIETIDNNVDIKEDNEEYDEEILMDKKSMILKYYRQGLTPHEIGKKLNIGTGEVMLFINLYNN